MIGLSQLQQANFPAYACTSKPRRKRPGRLDIQRRTARLYEHLRCLTEIGAARPTKRQLSRLVECQSEPAHEKYIKRLEKQGLIRLERGKYARSARAIVIIATGKVLRPNKDNK